MTNSRLTDPEVLEWRFPVRLERFALRLHSGGSGQYRGGNGVMRQFQFLEPMTVSLVSGHRTIARLASKEASQGKQGKTGCNDKGSSRSGLVA